MKWLISVMRVSMTLTETESNNHCCFRTVKTTTGTCPTWTTPETTTPR